MRPRDTRALALIALCVVAATLYWRWGELSEARAERYEVLERYTAVMTDARTVYELRATESIAQIDTGSTTDITASAQRLINEHLNNQTSIGRVQMEAPVLIDSTLYERVGASLVLNGITPSECALFLHHWNDTVPSWTPIAVRMNRARNQGRTDPGDRYDVTVSLERLVLSQLGDSTP